MFSCLAASPPTVALHVLDFVFSSPTQFPPGDLALSTHRPQSLPPIQINRHGPSQPPLCPASADPDVAAPEPHFPPRLARAWYDPHLAPDLPGVSDVPCCCLLATYLYPGLRHCLQFAFGLDKVPTSQSYWSRCPGSSNSRMGSLIFVLSSPVA